VDVVHAVLDGRADGGAIGSPFWKTVQSERLVPEGALREVWSSPQYNHCMFTAHPNLDPERERRFADALAAMSYDNPVIAPYSKRRDCNLGYRLMSMATMPCGRPPPSKGSSSRCLPNRLKQLLWR